MLNNTIVAISTPFGVSGIGIVRMSGKDSFIIADKIFRRKDHKRVKDMLSHSINHGWIIDPKSKTVIDEVLLSIMKGPKTYTKEDMIEINCHGGWIVLNRTMDLIIDLGTHTSSPLSIVSNNAFSVSPVILPSICIILPPKFISS